MSSALSSELVEWGSEMRSAWGWWDVNEVGVGAGIAFGVEQGVREVPEAYV